MQLPRNDQGHLRGIHRLQLALRDTLLNGKKVLSLNAFGLFRDLSPPVLAGSFYANHEELFIRPFGVIVFVSSRNDDVGLAIYRLRLTFKRDAG